MATQAKIGVEVRRSTLNTPWKRRARAGHRTNVIEAGEGLFATRKIKRHEHILDYRYKNGVRRAGEEVDWLTHKEMRIRYPPSPDNPHGTGTHVLQPNGHSFYYDTAVSGGVGGKANSRRGHQNATWSGSNIIAGNNTINPGDEIFVPYTTGSSYTFGEDDIDDERDNWYYVSRARRITNDRSRAKIGITPAPPRGGEGGNLQTGDRVFQHVAGVSAPT